MKRWMVVLAAAACVAAPFSAARAADEAADREQRLQEAQRKLQEAVREVAELSGQAAADAFGAWEFYLPHRRRALLGVNLGPAGDAGVPVVGVSPGGPAERAGVREGDVIVKVQDKPVTTGREIVRVMESVAPGDKVALGLTRDGKPLAVTVEARPFTEVAPARAIALAPAVTAFPIDGHGRGWRHWLLDYWGDAELVTMTPGLGKYFGTDKGVLVARAPEDKALGLQDGDVIVAIGGREPEDAPHAMRILRSYEPGEKVDLRILRDRREQTLSGTVPESARRHLLPPPPAPPRPGTRVAPPEPAAR